MRLQFARTFRLPRWYAWLSLPVLGFGLFLAWIGAGQIDLGDETPTENLAALRWLFGAGSSLPLCLAI